MPKITWKIDENNSITADVEPGFTLMEAAVDNEVPRVIGECGGCLSCATCHVVVDPEWRERVGEPEFMEDDMLDFTDVERSEGSRLSCQIMASDELDGLTLVVPKD